MTSTCWTIIQPHGRRTSCHCANTVGPGGRAAQGNQPDTEGQTLYDLTHVKSEKSELPEAACSNSYEGPGGGGVGEILVKGLKLPVVRQVSSRDLMYSNGDYT